MSVSSIVDIVFVALVVLLAVIGLYKGFLKSAISVIGTAASALFAFLLAEPFGKLLEMIFKLTTVLKGKVAEWLYSLSEFFTIARAGESFSDISAEMGSSGISKIVQKLTNLLLKGINIPEGESVGSIMGGKIAAILTTVIAFAVGFILIRIILKILEKLSDKITEVKIFGAIDKILGFVFGLAKGLLYAGIVAVVATVMGYFVPAVDAKIDSITSETKAFQKYYDFINYHVSEYLDEKLGKNDIPPQDDITRINIEDLSAESLAGVTHVYVLRDGGAMSGEIYFADEELTKENYATVSDFVVEYVSSGEYAQINDLISANETIITVIYQDIAVEKTLDEVKEMFADISYYYVDEVNKVVVFKVQKAEIDTDNYLFDADYKIVYTEDADLSAIEQAIADYNATAEEGKAIVETAGTIDPDNGSGNDPEDPPMDEPNVDPEDEGSEGGQENGPNDDTEDPEGSAEEE